MCEGKRREFQLPACEDLTDLDPVEVHHISIQNLDQNITRQKQCKDETVRLSGEGS